MKRYNLSDTFDKVRFEVDVKVLGMIKALEKGRDVTENVIEEEWENFVVGKEISDIKLAHEMFSEFFMKGYCMEMANLREEEEVGSGGVS